MSIDPSTAVSYWPQVDFAALAAATQENLGAAAARVSDAFVSAQETAQGYYNQIPSEVCYTPLEIAQGVTMVAVVAFLAGKLLGEEKEPVIYKQYVPFPVFIETERPAAIEQPPKSTIEAAAN